MVSACRRRSPSRRGSARSAGLRACALQSCADAGGGARFSEAERRLGQLKQAADTAGAEAEKTRADYAALQAKFSATEKAAEQHGASVAELTGVNEKISNEKATLDRQLAQARQSLELARVEAAGLRTANSKLSAADEAVVALRAELADAKAKLGENEKVSTQHSTSVAALTSANEKLTADLREMQQQLAALRTDNTKLAQSEEARLAAEQRASSLAATATQLTVAQRDLAASRAENARLSDSLQTTERDRGARIAQLQQDNAATAARLRQAQGTLDQIASAARLINGGGSLNTGISSLPPAAPAVAPTPAAPPAPAQPRIHLVAEGETLTRISMRYYGTSVRWQEIYDANRDILKGESVLRPGQRLKIP